jgi:glycosyltransferase involved in cell wall biosynthesis
MKNRQQMRTSRPGIRIIGLWSSDYTIVTGQAIVTARVVNKLPDIEWMEFVYRGSGFKMLLTWGGGAVRLWRNIARGRVRTLYLVCSRSTPGFLRDIPAYLAAFTGVRIVVHSHGSDIVDLLNNSTVSPLARFFLGRCDIIVPSGHLTEAVAKATRGKAYLCENFAEPDRRQAIVQISRQVPIGFRVLWNSNIMASKGFFDVARAVQSLNQRGGNVTLIALGKPIGDQEMQESECTSRLNELLAESWLEYRGPVDRQSAMDILLQSDVVCLPSRYISECQPLAIIEAMCAGRAIIVADTPALRATAGDYPANFVPTGSPDAIGAAIEHLVMRKQMDSNWLTKTYRAAAKVAAKRFSAVRFDGEMLGIISNRPPDRK